MGKFICAIIKSSLFWIIIEGILVLSLHILTNILIGFLWSFLMNKFLPSSLIFIKYFIILILFLYNWLILRKLVISWIFEWQFPIQKFSIYKERQNYISYLKLRFKNFVNAIEVILNVNSKISKKEIDDIELFLDIFNDQLINYEKLYNLVNNENNNNNIIRYKMSGCQIEFYNLLKSINHILSENDLKNNLLNLKTDDNIIEMNNFTVNQNFEIQKNLAQLNMLLKDYKKTIDKYDYDNYTYLSPSYLYNLLSNDTFGSLSLNSLQFKSRFEQYNLEENFTPKNKIYYTLISPKNNNINNNIKTDKNSENNLISENPNDIDRNLMIFCLPNGGCYELLPKTKVEFYLNLGFSFLCWNYRGYGYSKGRATFSNCKSAALELYDTVMANHHFKKICVMGHSIGGIAACYLAKNRPVDLLISDRNFCDMTRLVNNFYCGKLLSTLIKLLFIGNTDNINNFFNSNVDNIKNNGISKLKNINNEDKLKINKIIIYSPLDFLIANDSTVKSGVSRYITKNYIIYRNNVNNQIVKDKENFLDLVFNKNDKSRFINNFLRLLHFYYNDKSDNNINNEFIIDLKNQNENNNHNNININIEDESVNRVLFSFFDLFFAVCCDNLNYLSQKKISLRRETIFIDNFFNNILIWGTQGGDLPNEEFYEFYPYKGKKLLKESYDILNKYISEKQYINKSPIVSMIENVSKDLKIILDVMDNLDIVYKDKNQNTKINKENNNLNSYLKNNNDLQEKLITNDEKENEINTNIILNVDINKKDKSINDEFYIKLNNIKGNIKLFKSFAGHNGLLRPDEREQFFIFFLSTGIID